MFIMAATATTLTPGSPLPAYAKLVDWLLAPGAILPTMIWGGAQEFPLPSSCFFSIGCFTPSCFGRDFFSLIRFGYVVVEEPAETHFSGKEASIRRTDVRPISSRRAISALLTPAR